MVARATSWSWPMLDSRLRASSSQPKGVRSEMRRRDVRGRSISLRSSMGHRDGEKIWIGWNSTVREGWSRVLESFQHSPGSLPKQFRKVRLGKPLTMRNANNPRPIGGRGAGKANDYGEGFPNVSEMFGPSLSGTLGQNGPLSGGVENSSKVRSGSSKLIFLKE